MEIYSKAGACFEPAREKFTVNAFCLFFSVSQLIMFRSESTKKTENNCFLEALFKGHFQVAGKTRIRYSHLGSVFVTTSMNNL